jgi:sterol desaturase/sphingolipid hydroxylase (fatty acid hydroxylase superfamily)
MLSEFLHQYPQLAPLLSAVRQCAWLVILTLIFVPLEALIPVHREKIFSKSTLGDLGFYFISGVVPHLLLVVPLSLLAYVAYRYVPMRVHATVATWPLWMRGLAAFVIADLGFYWGHRWAHEIPFLWRFHSLHHSPEHIYFLISARAHPIDNAFIRLCGLIPIYILGLGAPQSVQGTLVATVLMLVVTVLGFFIHANIRWRLGPLEWLLSTPGFHHWHHVCSEYRNCNYASMLPWWDLIFRTHHLPKHWPPAYGIDTKLPSSVAGQLLYPLQPAPPPRMNAPESAGTSSS